MKKHFTFAVIVMASFCGTYAQEFPSYGKFTNEELQLQECAFDKEADAVVLVDEAISNYNSEYNLVTHRHIRIKILKEKGIRYGDISIPFYRKDDFEKIGRAVQQE